MAKSYVLFFLALTYWQLQIINCQNCVIGSISDGDTVEVGSELSPIMELTPPGEIIWSASTEGVTSATSAASSHFPYLSGLRWTERYDYKTADIFSTFIATERSPYIERNVTFTCADSVRKVYFKFNIKDENNSPPEFIAPAEGFEFDIRKQPTSEGNETGVVNHSSKIIVRDLDWDPKNADVKIMTTHNVFIAVLTRDPEVPFQEAYQFNVELQIIWRYAALGKYSFEILSDDGRFARRCPITVNVLP